nr:hypothetical protein [Candidatus Delongbacteria bacterium]
GMEWLGRRIVRRSVQSVIVVNDHLADLHRDYFRIPRPTVVMNCPESCPESVPPEPGLRRRLNITDDRPILIFQGNFSVRRGDVTALRNLVDALSLLSRPVALLLIGNITQRPEFAPFRRYCSLTARGDRRGKGSRVYFMPPVPPETLIHYTRQATLGLMIFNLSGYSCYCLPNKFFDYLHAGLPVISGPYPPVQALLERYPCGRICRDISPKLIAETIDGMLNQPELMEQMKHQAMEAARYFTWAGESFKLIELYRRLHSEGTK